MHMCITNNKEQIEYFCEYLPKREAVALEAVHNLLNAYKVRSFEG